jgi:hypothetical protein
MIFESYVSPNNNRYRNWGSGTTGRSRNNFDEYTAGLDEDSQMRRAMAQSLHETRQRRKYSLIMIVV